MENILVTGGAGFIGANFIRYLLAQSDFSGRVINLDKLTYAGNLANLDGIAAAHPQRYCFVHGDITDRDLLQKTADAYAIDTVCHFAAESHVDRSIVEPDAFVQTNIMGTWQLLEMARALGDRLVLFHHVSTDEVFGSLGPEGLFTESTPYRPNSPYSASKASSDHLVRAYHKTYGLPVTLSNCSNNYGPYQFPEKLIPLMILNALADKPLPVYGDGRNVRDWLYVTDHCRAVWAIMKDGRHGQTYNVGGNCEMQNIEVVRMICRAVDRLAPDRDRSSLELITYVKDRPGHDLRYAIDFGKLNRELDWEPVESFGTGIEKTISWYREHAQWVQNIQSGEYRSWIEQHYQLD